MGAAGNGQRPFRCGLAAGKVSLACRFFWSRRTFVIHVSVIKFATVLNMTQDGQSICLSLSFTGLRKCDILIYDVIFYVLYSQSFVACCHVAPGGVISIEIRCSQIQTVFRPTRRSFAFEFS